MYRILLSNRKNLLKRKPRIKAGNSKIFKFFSCCTFLNYFWEQTTLFKDHFIFFRKKIFHGFKIIFILWNGSITLDYTKIKVYSRVYCSIFYTYFRLLYYTWCGISPTGPFRNFPGKSGPFRKIGPFRKEFLTSWKFAKWVHWLYFFLQINPTKNNH